MALIIWSMVRDGSAQPASPTIFAGTPATVTLCGTALTTTEPAAIRAQWREVANAMNRLTVQMQGPKG